MFNESSPSREIKSVLLKFIISLNTKVWPLIKENVLNVRYIFSQRKHTNKHLFVLFRQYRRNNWETRQKGGRPNFSNIKLKQQEFLDALSSSLMNTAHFLPGFIFLILVCFLPLYGLNP